MSKLESSVTANPSLETSQMQIALVLIASLQLKYVMTSPLKQELLRGYEFIALKPQIKSLGLFYLELTPKSLLLHLLSIKQN